MQPTIAILSNTIRILYIFTLSARYPVNNMNTMKTGGLKYPPNDKKSIFQFSSLWSLSLQSMTIAVPYYPKAGEINEQHEQPSIETMNPPFEISSRPIIIMILLNY